MVPEKIFTSFAEFQEIVSANDFRLPVRLQELMQAPVCFLSKLFCFARIRLDLLGSQVLHHDCISMIGSSTSFTDNFVIGCNQIMNYQHVFSL